MKARQSSWRCRLGVVLLLLAQCAVCTRACAERIDAKASILQSLKAVRSASTELCWDALGCDEDPPKVLDAEVAEYFAFYRLDLPCERHAFGYVGVGEKRIATHVYLPRGKPRGSVTIVHGYFDHTATWRHAIRALLAMGFAVVIYDQPGHGLSSGARAAIGDFSEYVDVLKAIVEKTRQHLPTPYHLAAHSMGCAVAVDYLLTDSTAETIERAVFVAPLVRSAHWHLSNGGNRIVRPFVKTLPRAFKRNSSDKAYLAFVKKDPLHARQVPLAWVDALKRWNVRAMAFNASDRPVIIIQGDSDTTVDVDHSLRVLKLLFPQRKLVMIPDGRHQLLNEAAPLRQKTLDAMCSFLR